MQPIRQNHMRSSFRNGLQETLKYGLEMQRRLEEFAAQNQILRGNACRLEKIIGEHRDNEHQLAMRLSGGIDSNHSLFFTNDEFMTGAQIMVQNLNNDIERLRAKNRDLKGKYDIALQMGNVVESLHQEGAFVRQDLMWVMRTGIPLMINKVIGSEEFTEGMLKVLEHVMSCGRQLGQCDVRDGLRLAHLTLSLHVPTLALVKLVKANINLEQRLRDKFWHTLVAESTIKGVQDITGSIPQWPADLTSHTWTLYTDGALSNDGSGAGLILTDLRGNEVTYALRFDFPTSNNEAEYEALIVGLELATRLDTQRLLENFKSFSITQIPHSKNKRADALSKLASSSFAHLTKNVLVEVKPYRSIDVKEVLSIIEMGTTWMDPIVEYLKDGKIPANPAEYVLQEAHFGSCGSYSKARTLTQIVTKLEAPGHVKFLVVAVDYFTKWVEAEPLATINGKNILKFVWKNIVCRFDIPGIIISDNGLVISTVLIASCVAARYNISSSLGVGTVNAGRDLRKRPRAANLPFRLCTLVIGHGYTMSIMALTFWGFASIPSLTTFARSRQILLLKNYIKSKDIDLRQVIQNGNFYFEIKDSETKMMKETPYELLKNDQKKKIGKKNEAKMTLYNALPRKEYERVFMCKTAKEFSISSEETIDSGFTRFNVIITSLKSLDQDYSGKNHVSSCSSTKMESQCLLNDLGKLCCSFQEHQVKVKSLALKAKVIREQTSDDSDSKKGSDEYVDEEEAKACNLIARNFRKFFRKGNQFGRGNRFGNNDIRFERGNGISFGNKGGEISRQRRGCYNCGEEGHFIDECPKPKENKAFLGRAWSDSEDGDEP
ncbi:retrovirus-related pol polyprotein from transposon TNT 1-94 [Tanacetum coccineum]